MQTLTLDFETYYDKAYSLSKLTTEEYVRDPRFEVIGFAMAFGGKPPMWFSGSHDYLAARLENVDWSDTALLCHNTVFDASILSWHFDVHPKVLLDTMSMARPIVGPNQSVSLANLAKYFGLGAKGDEVIHALGKRLSDFTREELARYGEYCRNDVALTYELYTTMLDQGFPIEELKLIDLTLKMFTEPVLRLNPRKLDAHLHALRTDKRDLLVNCMKSAKRNDLAALVAMDDEDGKTQAQKLLRSDAQFAQLLEELGVEPATKISPKTGKTAYAFAKTDAAFKELVEHEDPAVQALAAARIGTKTTIEESRTERFMGIAQRGSFPVPLKYYAAHSGRWGGCLVADTEVIVQREGSVLQVNLTSVLDSDLVWDGVEFVTHDGMQLSGYAKVVYWDGVCGTHDHKVFTAKGAMALADAAAQREPILTAAQPKGLQPVTYPVYTMQYAEGLVPVFDIINCGPRHRFAANGKIVSNSDSVNLQNLASRGKHAKKLKRAIEPPEGYVILDCDSSQIEARVVAWLAGQEDLVQAFRDKEDVYSQMASRIYRRPVDRKRVEVDADGKEFNPDETPGQVGKTVILGCLTRETLVWTEFGWQELGEVGCTTELWDGEGYIQHHGVIYQGWKEVVLHDGVAATPDHHVWVGGGRWVEWSDIQSDRDLNDLALRAPVLPEDYAPPTPEQLEQAEEYLEFITDREGCAMTFDILNAGPNNRFMIWTDAGPLIVHNCGYGMGGVRFRDQLRAQTGIVLPPEETARIVKVYRETAPAIPKLWKDFQNALDASLTGAVTYLGPNNLIRVDPKGIRLPNGLYIQYPELQYTTNEDGKREMVYKARNGYTRIYGAKAVENVCQALARLIVGYQMLKVSRRYRVVLTVHDSVLAIARTEDAEAAKLYIEKCMRATPAWAEGLPIDCECKYGPSYGDVA